MAEIKLRATEAREHAGDIKGRATDSREQFDALRTRLVGLSDSFTGNTKDRFDERLDDWKTHADGLVDALDGLGAFLDSAATQIEDLDNSLAQGLQG